MIHELMKGKHVLHSNFFSYLYEYTQLYYMNMCLIPSFSSSHLALVVQTCLYIFPPLFFSPGGRGKISQLATFFSLFLSDTQNFSTLFRGFFGFQIFFKCIELYKYLLTVHMNIFYMYLYIYDIFRLCIFIYIIQTVIT